MRRFDTTKYFYDKAAAERVITFFERALIHYEGEYAGKPFVLEEWQKEQIIKPLFGIKRNSDGLRRYRQGLILLPRGNGKSALASGLNIYMTGFDGEPSAECYAFANSKEQARTVFDCSKAFIEESPKLKPFFEIYKDTIVHPRTRSKLQVLASDSRTQDGHKTHFMSGDEIHEMVDHDLWDKVYKGTIKRRQPLSIGISTAGIDDPNSLLGVWMDRANKIKKKIIEDDTFFACIYQAPKSDPIDDPKTWKKANPNLGVSVKEDYLAAESKKALQQPILENGFRRYHLNQFVNQAVRWMPMDKWDKCNGPVDWKDEIGNPCFAGLDMSSKVDLTALVLVFPPSMDDPDYRILPFCWIPGGNLDEKEKRDQVSYSTWIRENPDTVFETEGDVVDHNEIARKIVSLSSHFKIRELVMDDWNLGNVPTEVSEKAEEIELVGFRQGFKSMSEPTKELMNLVLGRKIRHGGHPVLRWNMDNTVAVSDDADNIKLSKKKSRQRIDLAIATVMGLARAMNPDNEDKESVYEERDLFVL